MPASNPDNRSRDRFIEHGVVCLNDNLIEIKILSNSLRSIIMSRIWIDWIIFAELDLRALPSPTILYCDWGLPVVIDFLDIMDGNLIGNLQLAKSIVSLIVKLIFEKIASEILLLGAFEYLSELLPYRVFLFWLSVCVICILIIYLPIHFII